MEERLACAGTDREPLVLVPAPAPARRRQSEARLLPSPITNQAIKKRGPAAAPQQRVPRVVATRQARNRKRSGAPARRPEFHSTPASEIKLPNKYRPVPTPKTES